MLQAHTDMVCAKEPWSRHDFLRDPIEIREKDGWKIWHLVIMTDFKTPVGQNWAQVNLAPTGSYYTAYTPKVSPQEGVPVPQPYRTFSETFSYA